MELNKIISFAKMEHIMALAAYLSHKQAQPAQCLWRDSRVAYCEARQCCSGPRIWFRTCMATPYAGPGRRGSTRSACSRGTAEALVPGVFLPRLARVLPEPTVTHLSPEPTVTHLSPSLSPAFTGSRTQLLRGNWVPLAERVAAGSYLW